VARLVQRWEGRREERMVRVVGDFGAFLGYEGFCCSSLFWGELRVDVCIDLG